MIRIPLKERILYSTLVLAVVTIPLLNNWNSIALILFVCAAAFQRPVTQWWEQLRKNKLWLVPLIMFFWLLSTWFWDASGGFTVKQWERYLGLVFIPFGIALSPPIPAKQIRIACFGFVITIITLCLICLVRSYIEYQHTHDYRVFYYHYLSEQVRLNAIFLSIYCLASIFWSLYFGFLAKQKLSITVRVLLSFGILFLIVMILFLTSKMIILLGSLATVFSLLYFGYRKGLLLKASLAVLVLLVAGFFAIKHLPYLQYRLDVTKLQEYKGEEDRQNGIAIRVLMWKTGLDLIRQRPLLGYGIKGGRDKVVEQYKERGFSLGYELKYHTHNEYIEMTVMSGIPGLLLFLTMAIGLLWRAVKTTNPLLLFGILHFMIFSLIESLFEVQQEMIFFIFFLFLFYYHPPRRSI